jgi:alanine racemase
VSPGRVPPGAVGRPTAARVDLDALEHNVRLAVRLAGPGRRVLAVVKANAYGHGAAAVARAALRAGAAKLGVATLGEARQLRDAGIDAPVLLLSEPAPAAADEVVRLGCAATLYTLALAEALEAAAARAGRPVGAHVKIDTGMGRVGLEPAEALPFVARVRQLRHVVVEGLMTHLAEAEREDGDATARQLDAFAGVCAAIEAMGGPVRWRHAANSALLLRGAPPGNLVRPGLMLYGAPPAPGLPHAGELRPVLTLATAIAFLKRVPAGTPLSYNGTFVTARESLVATLPVGYADGYRRALSNRGAVLVRGRRAPVVGTVCMDLCLADVTDVPGAAVGDEVVLIGRQGAQAVTADEVAALAGTISYEVFCGVGPRVPRVHSGGPGGYDAPGPR